MILKIRRWFFKLLTGMSLSEFILGNIEATQIRKDIEELQSAYTDLLKEWLNMQEAISSLHAGMIEMNKNVYTMSETQLQLVHTVNSHNDAIEQLIQDEVILTSFTTNKPN